MNGHWNFPIDINVDDWFGFIYRIIEISTGREYIGKKQFWSITRKKITGRKNKKVIRKESDWKEYTGSSTSLNNSIELNGKNNYLFFIESLHETKGSLFYAEVETQVKEDVLRTYLSDGITPKYYNRQIAGVRFIPAPPTLKESAYNVRNYGRDNSVVLCEGLTCDEFYGGSNIRKLKKSITSCSRIDGSK